MLWVELSREKIPGGGSLNSTIPMEEGLVLREKKKSSKVIKHLHWL